MKPLLSFFPAKRPSRLAVALALLLGVVAGAAPARAAFPGVPGPIAYSKSVYSEESGTSGGLFTHGPRRRQGSHRLTSDRGDTSPSYSADGRTIVFAGNRDPGATYFSHIYLMNADGSGVRMLTSGDNYDSDPSFSPDGRRVVFARADGANGSAHIFIINVDGSGLRQLTDGMSADYDPVFAPNGKWIAFVSDRDKDASSDRSDVFSMRADGSAMGVLIDGPREEYAPDISPDGRRIAFVSTRNHGPHIFVAKSSGRRIRALTRSRRRCSDSLCYHSPAWAPDGKHIAFLSSGCCHVTRLEVMRPDGSQRKQLTYGGTDEEFNGTVIGVPAWGAQPR